MADLVSPHNLEAERAVLGAVFIDNGVFPQAAGVVTPDTFFRSAHRHIWRALATVIGRGEAADLVTIKNELDRGGVLEDVGGAAYVA